MHGLRRVDAPSWNDAGGWAARLAMTNDVMIQARIGDAHESGEPGTDRRSSERLAVAIDARLRELGTTGTEARVLNLSETGFMAETGELFEVGARVWLMLPGRDRANAVVRWVAAGKIGAEFAEPLELP